MRHLKWVPTCESFSASRSSSCRNATPLPDDLIIRLPPAMRVSLSEILQGLRRRRSVPLAPQCGAPSSSVLCRHTPRTQVFFDRVTNEQNREPVARQPLIGEPVASRPLQLDHRSKNKPDQTGLINGHANCGSYRILSGVAPAAAAPERDLRLTLPDHQ